MRILALTKYGPLAASTRQRFLQYRPAFKESGIELIISPLLDDEHIRRLVAGKRAAPLQVLRAYSRRLAAVLTAGRYDLIWVHCELFPYLPGVLERLIQLAGRPVVYDCDDAIFHNYDAAKSGLVRKLLGTRLHPLLKTVTACTCGNPYVAAYCQQHCLRNLVIPTVVDTDRYIPVELAQEPLVIGWIGSPSTWQDVRPYLEMLKRLHDKTGVRIRAVGAGAAAKQDIFPGLELAEWNEGTEIIEVQAFSIGIMPVSDAPFQRGKSGYKLVQYMACGLPIVASPVGVNHSIVDHGTNGFQATSESEWRKALERLIADPAMRATMGAAGRVRAVADFSLAVHAPRLIELFQSVVGGGRR